MIYLNLVSEKLKEEIRLRHIYDIIKDFYILFILVFLIIIIILYIANGILSDSLKDVITQDETVSHSAHIYSDRISKVNNRIKLLEDSQNGFFFLSLFFKDISDISNNISYEHIRFEKNMLKLKARAKNRNDFLIFDKKLKELSYLENIKYSFENIPEDNNVEFVLDVNIELNKSDFKL